MAGLGDIGEAEFDKLESVMARKALPTDVIHPCDAFSIEQLTALGGEDARSAKVERGHVQSNATCSYKWERAHDREAHKAEVQAALMDAIRAGGDLNGRNQGRLRMVNNTILFTRPGTANAVLVQLGQGSVEMHNNLIHQAGARAAPNILRVHEASEVRRPYCAPTGREPWSNGRKVAGSNNWVQDSARLVPAELDDTRRGTAPGLEDIEQLKLRPRASSALVAAGNPSPAGPTGFAFPSPLPLPRFDPPQREKMAIGAEVRRTPGTGIAVGAFEGSAGGGAPGR